MNTWDRLTVFEYEIDQKWECDLRCKSLGASNVFLVFIFLFQGFVKIITKFVEWFETRLSFVSGFNTSTGAIPGVSSLIDW